MCGIVGLISRRTNGFWGSELEMFENLLVLDTMRGMDSTGAFCVHGSKKISVIKHATHPLHTFKTEEWSKFRQGAISTGRILIGHNRKATQGSVNSENAHPFVENHIVLVHNGTLRGHKELADKDVDSHAVCHAFAEKGAENVIPDLDGAFAFVWWDAKKERLFAIRNDERPLAFVITDDAIAVASEPWMATALFSRGGKKVTGTTIIEPGDLYSIGLDAKHEITKIKFNEKPVYQYPPQGRGAPFRGCANDCDSSEEDWWNAMGEGWSSQRAVVPFRTRPNLLTPEDNDDIPQQRVIEEDRAKEVAAILRLRSRGEPHIDQHFKVGEDTLVKFTKFSAPSNDTRVQAIGKVCAPGKPEYDVCCWMPSHFDIADGTKWSHKPLVVTVSMAMESACGPSLWVHTPRFPKKVQTNNEEITEAEWQHICANEKCSHCSAPIFAEEALFTTVTKHYGGKYKITCPDCVSDKLPEGEMKNDFIKRRSAAIQDGVTVSTPALTDAERKAGTSGTPNTLH
jgi:hypothetical protein